MNKDIPIEMQDELPNIARMCIFKPITLIGSQTGIERTPFMIQILKEIALQKKGKALIHSLELSEYQFRKQYALWSDDIIVDDTPGWEMEEQWMESRIEGIPNLVAVGIDMIILANTKESISYLSMKYKLPFVLTTPLSRCASDHKNGGRPWLIDLPKDLPSECCEFVLLLWREHLTNRGMGGTSLMPIGTTAEVCIYMHENNCQVSKIVYGNVDKNDKWSLCQNGNRYIQNISLEKFMYDAYTFTNAFNYVKTCMFSLIEYSVKNGDITFERGEELKQLVLRFKEEWIHYLT